MILFSVSEVSAHLEDIRVMGVSLNNRLTSPSWLNIVAISEVVSDFVRISLTDILCWKFHFRMSVKNTDLGASQSFFRVLFIL